MSWTIRFIGLLAIGLLVATAAQHLRYRDIRYEVAKDAQAAFHSPTVFHVITLLEGSADRALLPALKELATTIEAQGGEVVYAGKVAANALHSTQLPEAEWDAFLLTQFGDRDDYEASLLARAHETGLDGFETSYSLGMQRRPLLNLSLPLTLLGRRFIDLMFLKEGPYPFTPAEPTEANRERHALAGRVLDERALGENALMVLNVVREGDLRERAANASYNSQITSLLAEVGGGPLHMGRAVTLEGDAIFDQVTIVFYPGVRFFADLVSSEFYGSIAGSRQVADSLSLPSVPLLPRLDLES